MMKAFFFCFIITLTGLFWSVTASDGTVGTLKDFAVKLQKWDLVDSPKRIGEDIGQNASREVKHGVEEVKETVESVMETTPNEVLTRSKNAISDVWFLVSYAKSGISWCHLLGFSTAYGMGVWVTLFSHCVLGKSLPKQQCTKLLRKLNKVYFRVMGCCVGGALFGFLVSQGGIRGVLSNKMEMFQGFNLVSALVMILTNVIFLEPQATKFMKDKSETQIVGATKLKNIHVMKDTSETQIVAAKKLKKIHAYSSTLNVSTMMVLTWHLAYIGQLLQARH